MDKKLKKCWTCKYHDTEPNYDRSHREVCTRRESWNINGFCSCEHMRKPYRECGPYAKLYSPKKRKPGTYTTDEMVALVSRLIAYLDNRDWRRVEDIFPNRYEREVAKKLAAGDGELMHCAMCGHWKWNEDMSGQCSLQLKGRCDKFYRKDQQWR